MLIVSGPLATSIGDVIGLGSQTVTAWNIAKWPVIVLFAIAIVAILYYATPNVKQPRFRWLSIGAVVAILVWIVASVGFAFYVATFGSYDKTYGSLAGVIVGLLWLWITNLALLFGAELDSELERGRELQAGIPAERELQLEPRDTRGIRKAEKKERKDVERGRAIREEAAAREADEDGEETEPTDQDEDGNRTPRTDQDSKTSAGHHRTETEERSR
jgi:membrane protein